MVNVKLDLLAHQRIRLCVAKQLTQRFAVGGVDNERPYLHNARNTLLLERKYILVFLAALERHHTVPQGINGQHRLHIIVDILSAEIFRITHLPQTFVAGQLTQIIFCHHNSVTSNTSESVTRVAISCKPLALHLA